MHYHVESLVRDGSPQMEDCNDSRLSNSLFVSVVTNSKTPFTLLCHLEFWLVHAFWPDFFWRPVCCEVCWILIYWCTFYCFAWKANVPSSRDVRFALLPICRIAYTSGLTINDCRLSTSKNATLDPDDVIPGKIKPAKWTHYGTVPSYRWSGMEEAWTECLYESPRSNRLRSRRRYHNE